MSRYGRTGQLVRLNLRRDRFRILMWILILAALMASVAWKFEGIYGTPTEINAIKGTLASPGIVAMFGAFSFSGKVTTAEIFANEMLLFMGLIQVVMNLALSVHATRAEEDLGITELVRAHAVGTLAPLSAAAIELVLVNGLLGLLYGAGLTAANMPGATIQGNWLIGIGLAAAGLLFGMLGLLTAQVADHSSSATGLAYTLFGLSYLAQMVTDVQHPKLTWWSPLGWVEKLAPYNNPTWLPVWLSLGLALILLAIAFWANSHRDLGVGAITTRPGRKQASVFLRGPISLIWRRQRNVLIGWLVGIIIFGAAYGTVFNTIGDILKTNPTMQQVFGATMVHEANHSILVSFTALLAVVMAAVAVIPGMQLILKLHTDETRGWLEALYARPLSRTRLLFSYVGTAFVTSTLAYIGGLAGIVVMGDASLTHVKDGISASEFWQAAAAQLPEIWVFLALSVLLVGCWPRLKSLSWAYLALGFVSVYMGSLLKLPGWVKNLTPAGWMPRVPIHDVNWTTFSWMVSLALVLILIGWMGYRRRDLHMS
ncbi:ABC transporter permease [Levilactobacillus tongjiangensis]|uniref:ABC transporter permease n=1 Tax=Levilactobacillus tongjiangensis TaxID=2486023 RepID=A0ABW1SQV6_9LACO|nr:permease [Levilactobacillus tongjiangensis]